jgi:hypothetical protein
MAYNYPIDPRAKWIQVTVVGAGEPGSAERPGRAGTVTPKIYSIDELAARGQPLVVRAPTVFEEANVPAEANKN